MKRFLIVSTTLFLAATTMGAVNGVISVNFSISGNDANSVDAGETAIVGTDAQDSAITNAVNVDGSYWNKILLRATGVGAPTTFTANTQSGNSLSLQDNTGSSVVTMTSAGGFYCNFSDATTGAALTSEGEAGLIQSFLNLNDNESVIISGLADWAPNGYRIIAFCEAGKLARTMAITISDGMNTQTTWYKDDTTAANDGDSDEDGLIEWREATGYTSAGATTNGNYCAFETILAGDVLTITGDSTGGRAVLNGMQIIALGTDFPDTAVVPVTSGLELWVDATDVDGDGRSESTQETGIQNSGEKDLFYLRNWINKAGDSNAVYQAGNAPLFVSGGGNGGTDVSRWGGNDRMFVNGMSLGTNVTIIAVFKGTTNEVSQQIFNSNGFASDGGNYILEQGVNSKITGRVYNGGDPGIITSSSTVSPDRPTLATYRYAESSAPGADLFWDHAAGGTSDDTDPIMTVTANASIGAHPSNGTDFLDGDLYELLVYDRRLTDAEVYQVSSYLNEKYQLGIDYSAALCSVNFYRPTSVVWTYLDPSETVGLISTQNWLNVDSDTSRTFAPVTLRNSNGFPVPITIESSIDPGAASNNGVGNSTPHHKLMNGAFLLDNGDGTDTGTITVSGLAVNEMPLKYKLYLYFETSDNNREHTITVNGTSISGRDDATFNGTYIKATGAGTPANYMLFDNMTATSFTIDATATNGRAGLAGFQIVEIPEPEFQGTIILIQ